MLELFMIRNTMQAQLGYQQPSIIYDKIYVETRSIKEIRMHTYQEMRKERNKYILHYNIKQGLAQNHAEGGDSMILC